MYAAGKADLPLTSIRVVATGTYAGPRFSAIDIAVEIGGVDPSETAGLIVAAERVCYVTRTLRMPPQITVSSLD